MFSSVALSQVAIACAFLTGGGAVFLKKHAARLRLSGSFLVVAWEPPTTLFLDALEELHSLFPGNLYVHLGAQTPVEKHVGRGLMHSKLFFARAGGQCWLWTGSHNLTASATQGVNREAAIVLEGSIDEQASQGRGEPFGTVQTRGNRLLSVPSSTDASVAADTRRSCRVPCRAEAFPLVCSLDACHSPTTTR